MKKKYVKPQVVTIKPVKREFPAALIASAVRAVVFPQMPVTPQVLASPRSSLR